MTDDFHSYSNQSSEGRDVKSFDANIVIDTKPFIAPADMCRLLCGGADCRNCKPELRYTGSNMVIEGLYSSWVTSDILAMARPSTSNINKFLVVEAFIKCGLGTVINMQNAGEHDFCGHPLNESGFSYDPNVFMKSGIDYFNFPCEDHGVERQEFLLEITKIMQHQLSKGKVAVHCHAGLGRTGLVIACYLVFNNGLTGLEAINYVRSKRKNSIKTAAQEKKVVEFAAFLQPFLCVFWTPACNFIKFSLQEAVLRQKKLTHCTEASILHSIPQVLYLCLWKISKIAQGAERSESDLFASRETSCGENPVSEESIPSTNKDHNRSTNSHQEFLRLRDEMELSFTTSIGEESANTILYCFNNPYPKQEALETVKNDLNVMDVTWKKLCQVEDIHFHCQLVMDYLDTLKFPVLRTPDIEMLDAACDDDPSMLLLRLETCVARTVAMFLGFIDQCRCLGPSHLWRLRSLIFSRLTHTNVQFSACAFDSASSHRYQWNLTGRLMENLESLISLS